MAAMTQTIVFIHGMFQNAKSWEHWVTYFSRQGYSCLAPSWPLHEGEPTALRSNPPKGLGTLRLNDVLDHFIKIVSELKTPPIAIGHSVGGLVVQKLAERDLIEAGVAIASVAPNRMLAPSWDLIRNGLSIANPFAGDKTVEMTADSFHRNFANVLSRKQSDAAYAMTATHDSRNVLRDCLKGPGQIDLSLSKCPLFFIGAERDRIIPAALCEKNARAYTHRASYLQFSNRGHFICGENGWQEVVSSVAAWLGGNASLASPA